MTILDTNIVIVKDKKPILENITVATFVEYPSIIYYKHFHRGMIFPIRGDFILVHKI